MTRCRVGGNRWLVQRASMSPTLTTKVPGTGSASIQRLAALGTRSRPGVLGEQGQAAVLAWIEWPASSALVYSR